MSYKNKEWLIQKRITEALTLKEIGEEVGISESTVRYWLRKFEITTNGVRRTSIRATPVSVPAKKMSRKERKRQRKALKKIK